MIVNFHVNNAKEDLSSIVYNLGNKTQPCTAVQHPRNEATVPAAFRSAPCMPTGSRNTVDRKARLARRGAFPHRPPSSRQSTEQPSVACNLAVPAPGAFWFWPGGPDIGIGRACRHRNDGGTCPVGCFNKPRHWNSARLRGGVRKCDGSRYRAGLRLPGGGAAAPQPSCRVACPRRNQAGRERSLIVPEDRRLSGGRHAERSGQEATDATSSWIRRLNAHLVPSRCVPGRPYRPVTQGCP